MNTPIECKIISPFIWDWSQLWNRDIDNSFPKKRKYWCIHFIDCTIHTYLIILYKQLIIFFKLVKFQSSRQFMQANSYLSPSQNFDIFENLCCWFTFFEKIRVLLNHIECMTHPIRKAISCEWHMEIFCLIMIQAS